MLLYIFKNYILVLLYVYHIYIVKSTQRYKLKLSRSFQVLFLLPWTGRVSWGKSTEFEKIVSLICNVFCDDLHQSRIDCAPFCATIVLYYLLTCFFFCFMRSLKQRLYLIHLCISTAYCLANVLVVTQMPINIY